MTDLASHEIQLMDFSFKAKLKRWWGRNKPRRWVVGLAAVLALLAGYLHMSANAQNGQAAELKERAAIRAKVARLLDADDFAGLDKLAETYRKTEARTSSGIWKLNVFYSGFHTKVKKAGKDDPVWRSVARKLAIWQSQFPDSPTPIIANAIVMKRYAPTLRSPVLVQRASTAASDEDAAFVTTLIAAKAHLEKHKAVASRDPHYYVIWANLAFALGRLGADDATFFDIMIEGMQSFPEYYPIYFAAMDYVAPPARGDAKALEALANMAVEQTRSVDGLSLYARVYWTAHSSYFGKDLFRRSDVNWQKMSAAIDDILKRFPDQWNINNFAYFSCLAGDVEKTRSLLARIEGKPVREVWKTGTAYRACENLAKAG